MKKNKGFTLMEVIVVIAILAILAAIAVPTITGYIEESRETADLQVATNIVRATELAVVMHNQELPDDAIIEVLWCTGYADTSVYKDMLIVREVTSWRRPDGYGSTPKIKSLENVQKSIIGTLGYTAQRDKDGYWLAKMDTSKSQIAEESNFVFHIHTGTGEVKAAYYTEAIDGVKNIWITEMGVNIEPAE